MRSENRNHKERQKTAKRGEAEGVKKVKMGHSWSERPRQQTRAGNLVKKVRERRSRNSGEVFGTNKEGLMQKKHDTGRETEVTQLKK